MLRDQLEDARAHLDVAEGIARRVGFPWAVMLCDQARAGALLIEGQLDAAAAIAEAATEDARAVDLEPRTADLLHVLAQVAMRRGDLALARQYADRLEFLLREGASLVATVTNTVSGRLAFAEGDPARALRDLEPAYDSPTLLALMRNDCPLAPELVRISLAAAAPGRASVVVVAAQRYAERNPAVASLGAQSLHASGMLANDVAQLREALALYERSPRMLARPIAADDLADALLEREQTDEAIALLRRAAAEFSALGARRDVDRVRAKLRTLGVRTRTSTAATRPPTGWDALTPAEQNVARLAAEALTNRQIAERLFLSPHTVTTHLRHVFAKLAIRSRVELVRLVPA
jgi:DNA-binding CsgD family transcriptional regulator